METITVEELIEKLSHFRDKSMKVYMLTDRSDDNYDEEGRPIIVHPIEFVEKETLIGNDGWDNSDEHNILLEISDHDSTD
jgi:hypothetical protein